MNKKMMFIFAIICIIVFIIFYYIFYISGNNIIRNQKEFVEDIFEKFEKYEANIDVIITSNKNENKYNINQYVDGENSKLVINSPENVNGLEIEIKDNNLKITNKKTDMEKIYDDYKVIIKNSLFIDSFIEEFKEFPVEMYETDNEIVIKMNLEKNKNTYIKFKELYLNKETGMPTKLVIKDNNQKINTSIIYNDMKIK